VPENDNLQNIKLYIFKDFSLKGTGAHIEIGPFINATAKGLNDMAKVDAGIEANIYWLKYIDLNFRLQHSSVKTDENNSHFLDFDKEAIQLSNQLNIKIPFTPIIFGKTIEPLIINNYIFDLENSRGTRNEVGIKLQTNITEHIRFGLEWRHLDPIKLGDTDEAILFLGLRF
jgi:hypothetical protein